MVAAVTTSNKKLSTGGALRARTPLSNEEREGVNGSGRGAVTTPVTDAVSHTVTYPQTGQKTPENQPSVTDGVTPKSHRDLSTGVIRENVTGDSKRTPTVTPAVTDAVSHGWSHGVTEVRS